MEAAPVAGLFHLVHCSTRGFVHSLPLHVLTSCSSPRCTWSCMSALTKTPSASRPNRGRPAEGASGATSAVRPRSARARALFSLQRVLVRRRSVAVTVAAARSSSAEGAACQARSCTDRGQAAPVRRGGRTEAPGLDTVGARDGAWARGRAGDGAGSVVAASPPAAVSERTDVGRAGVGQMVRRCRDCVAQGRARACVCAAPVSPAAACVVGRRAQL